MAALLASIPELAGRELAHRPLAGGPCNRSLLLRDATGGRWVLRLNAPVPGVDRAREAAVLRAIEGQPWAPRIVRNDPAAGFLLSRYETARPWTPAFARSAAGQTALGRWLRVLHALPAKALPAVDVLAALEGYLAQLPGATRAPLARRGAALAASWRRAAAPGPGVLVHLDLNVANVLGEQRPERVIDWEFAGRGHPALDLAFFLHYQGLDERSGAALLDAYQAGARLRRQTASALGLAALLDEAWHRAVRARAAAL